MAGTAKVAIVGAALSDIGRVDTKTPFELHFQAASRALAESAPVGWPEARASSSAPA